MAASMITFRLLRITLNILSVFILYSSAIRFNVYKHYYLEDSCASHKSVEYKLEKVGMDSTAMIGLSRNRAYGNNRNCTVTIRPPLGHGVILHVDSFSFGSILTCYSEHIKIMEDNSTTTLCHQNYDLIKNAFITEGAMTIVYRTYDLRDPSPVTKSFHRGESMTIVYRTYDFRDPSPVTESFNRGEFKFIVTAYKKGSPFFGTCRDDQFKCLNRLCIWSGLTCDKVNNCGDNSDENLFGSSNCRIPDIITFPPLEEWTIDFPRIDLKPYPKFQRTSEVTIGAAVASVVLIILGAMVRFFCYYQCAEQRRRNEITGIAVVRTRRVITSPFRQPPPPYMNLVNETSSTPGGTPFPTTENDPSCDNPPTYSEAVAQTQSGNKEEQQSSATSTVINGNFTGGGSQSASLSSPSLPASNISTVGSNLSAPILNTSLPVSNPLPPTYQM